MKKIIFMALFAATLSACSNENNEVTQETTNLKSIFLLMSLLLKRE